jgi:hypothetical protein
MTATADVATKSKFNATELIPGVAALVNATASWNEVDDRLYQSVDWEAFEEAGRYHGVLPLASHHILESSLGRTLSLETRARLRQHCHDNLARSFGFYQELLRIVSAFDRSEIAIMPYKGPAFAEEFWGSFALRECSDLDFLVQPHSVEEAGEALMDLGYRRVIPIAKHLRRALVRNASEEQYRHIDTGLLLELQWSPAPRVFATRFDVDGMWRRAGRLALQGQIATKPAPEDLLLLLAIHGWKHNWSRLIWVADLAQLLRRSDLNWNLILESARRTRNLKVLTLALQVVYLTFNLALPTALAKPEPEIVRVAEMLTRRMFLMQPCKYMDWHRFMLETRDTALDRVNQVARFLLTPGLGEYAACDLPSWCSSGYRAVRLMRVLRLMPNKALHTLD